jgi:UDP-GlcNAc:undecaprenyl-phosphate/decaprenyl-phosphate GlcNAc-1-phosphate transferase
MGGTPDEIRAIAAFLLALCVTALAVPPMRRLAIRTGFLDHPVGYKEHPEATPYLGGAALMAGFLVAAIAFASGFGRLAPITLCAIALFVIGVFDDRVGLGIGPRLAVQVGAGVVLWLADFGWGFGNEALELAVTVFWVVGVTNAFNLMDNVDGAAGTVGAVSAAGAGTLAAVNGDPALGALAFALAGACAGFLPFNLARPSRIFLGDGGSMPVGLVVAAVIMSSPESSLGWAGLLVAAPLAGLPILDTTLVVISRYRRGVAILSGGRDHLTHRLLAPLGSVRAVVIALALAQGFLCLLGMGLDNLQREEIAMAAAGYLACGVLAITLLDAPKLLLGGSPRTQAAEEHSA